MDFEETEDRVDCAGEDQLKLNRSTDYEIVLRRQ
jgi:hypothetical protein